MYGSVKSFWIVRFSRRQKMKGKMSASSRSVGWRCKSPGFAAGFPNFRLYEGMKVLRRNKLASLTVQMFLSRISFTNRSWSVPKAFSTLPFACGLYAWITSRPTSLATRSNWVRVSGFSAASFMFMEYVEKRSRYTAFGIHEYGHKRAKIPLPAALLHGRQTGYPECSRSHRPRPKADKAQLAGRLH